MGYLEQNNRITKRIMETYPNTDDVIPRLTEFYGMSVPYLIDKEAIVVDLGCRDGYLLQILQQNGFTNIHGVESCQEAVVEAEAKGFSPIIGNIEQMDFYPDDYFDYVFCSHTLEHVQYPQSAVDEIFRILKVGGFAQVEIPVENPEVVKPPEDDGHYSPFTNPEQLDIMFLNNGFEIIEHTRQTAPSRKPWHRWVWEK